MKSSQHNPPGNALPQGMKPEQLEEAVQRSGYPLQTVAAVELQKHFGVTEEWGYVDRETGKQRALDIFAYKRLHDAPVGANLIYPSMALLVECKRSDLPFVFFKSVTSYEMPEFPAVYGLWYELIDLRAKNVGRSVTPAEALCITELDFVKAGPTICSTFSKANRKGKGVELAKPDSMTKENQKGKAGELELSGAETFSGIVLPLVSAMEHVRLHYKSRSNMSPYYPTLVIAACVLDAPMIVADATARKFLGIVYRTLKHGWVFSDFPNFVLEEQ